MALPFFFAAFRPADFNLRVRMAFLVAALRFLGMGIPLCMSDIWHGPYSAYHTENPAFNLGSTDRKNASTGGGRPALRAQAGGLQVPKSLLTTLPCPLASGKSQRRSMFSKVSIPGIFA